MNNSIPGMFTLVNGTKIVQTSAHDVRFSDGTAFIPTDEEKEQIAQAYKFLQVDRKFETVPEPVPGIKLSTSKQSISEENLKRLRELCDENKDAYILVSFLVISALREMGIRDQFSRVIAGNATRETSRETPDKKIWDVNNMAY
jgi:hypothetical protein